MTDEPSPKGIVEKELRRFREKPEVSIEEFCIRVNKARMKKGLKPIKGTPFEGKDGLVYQYSGKMEYRTRRLE